MAPSLLRSLRRRREPGGGAAGLQTVRVHALTPVSDRALLIELRPGPDGAVALAPFEAGAHIDLHLDERLVRPYSLVGADTETDRYLVCVQREPDGRGGSAAVHERLRVGDRIRVSRPRNTFPLREDAASVLLLAGGVGITPLVAMAERLHRRGTAFELHAYARNAAALPLQAHLRAAPYRARVVTHFSDEGGSFRAGGPDALTRPAPGGAVYVCGPTAFIDIARERAIAAGWHPDAVVSERFVPAGAAGTADDSSFTVVAASTGQAMRVEPGESIADVLERHGYESLRSCGQGYCGSCVTRVISGVPDHRDTFQDDGDHASNAAVNVCCSRSLTPVLELDV